MRDAYQASRNKWELRQEKVFSISTALRTGGHEHRICSSWSKRPLNYALHLQGMSEHPDAKEQTDGGE